MSTNITRKVKHEQSLCKNGTNKSVTSKKTEQIFSMLDTVFSNYIFLYYFLNVKKLVQTFWESKISTRKHEFRRNKFEKECLVK